MHCFLATHLVPLLCFFLGPFCAIANDSVTEISNRISLASQKLTRLSNPKKKIRGRSAHLGGVILIGAGDKRTVIRDCHYLATFVAIVFAAPQDQQKVKGNCCNVIVIWRKFFVALHTHKTHCLTHTHRTYL